MVVALYLSQWFRVLDLLLICLFLALFPIALFQMNRPARTWYLIGAVDFAYISGAISLVVHFDDPISWYRAPLMFCGAVCGFIYLWQVRKGVHAHQVFVANAKKAEEDIISSRFP